MIKFYKVSYEQFRKDLKENEYMSSYPEEQIKEIYDNIILPKRATKGSAGYDFYAPTNLVFDYGKSDKFPTGIRCEMDEDVVLLLVPRSSLGFKYRLQMDNTIGVIDAKI